MKLTDNRKRKSSGDKPPLCAEAHGFNFTRYGAEMDVSGKNVENVPTSGEKLKGNVVNKGFHDQKHEFDTNCTGKIAKHSLKTETSHEVLDIESGIMSVKSSDVPKNDLPSIDVNSVQKVGTSSIVNDRCDNFVEKSSETTTSNEKLVKDLSVKSSDELKNDLPSSDVNSVQKVGTSSIVNDRCDNFVEKCSEITTSNEKVVKDLSVKSSDVPKNDLPSSDVNSVQKVGTSSIVNDRCDNFVEKYSEITISTKKVVKDLSVESSVAPENNDLVCGQQVAGSDSTYYRPGVKLKRRAQLLFSLGAHPTPLLKSDPILNMCPSRKYDSNFVNGSIETPSATSIPEKHVEISETSNHAEETGNSTEYADLLGCRKPLEGAKKNWVPAFHPKSMQGRRTEKRTTTEKEKIEFLTESAKEGYVLDGFGSFTPIALNKNNKEKVVKEREGYWNELMSKNGGGSAQGDSSAPSQATDPQPKTNQSINQSGFKGCEVMEKKKLSQLSNDSSGSQISERSLDGLTADLQRRRDSISSTSSSSSGRGKLLEAMRTKPCENRSHSPTNSLISLRNYDVPRDGKISSGNNNTNLRRDSISSTSTSSSGRGKLREALKVKSCESRSQNPSNSMILRSNDVPRDGEVFECDSPKTNSISMSSSSTRRRKILEAMNIPSRNHDVPTDEEISEYSTTKSSNFGNRSSQLSSTLTSSASSTISSENCENFVKFNSQASICNHTSESSSSGSGSVRSNVSSRSIERCKLEDSTTAGTFKSPPKSSSSSEHRSNYEMLGIEQEGSPNSSKLRGLSKFQIVHVEGTSVVPYEGLKSFNNNISLAYRTLAANEKFRTLLPIQTYCFSSINAGHSTFIVATHGKRLGYVMPIMDGLVDILNKPVVEGNGPLVVIVCNGAKSVRELHKLCLNFANLNADYGRRDKTRVLWAYGGCGKERDVAIQKDVVSGCEVLVTTPHWLVRNIANHMTNLKRVRTIVFNNTDVLLKPPFVDQVEIIRRMCQRQCQTPKVQWIASGHECTSQLLSLRKKLDQDGCLLIANQWEAAFQCGIKVTTAFYPTKELKNQHVIDILKEIQASGSACRTVIMCSLQAEADHVGHVVKEAGLGPMVVEGHMDRVNGIPEINLRWRNVPYTLVVCSDSNLDLLDIDNADYLIHYSLPMKYASQFGQRFALVMGHYSPTEPEKIKNVKSLIILDPETQVQMPKLLTKLGVKDHEVVKEILRCKDLEHPIKVLCHKLVSRGECPQAETCLYRHVIVPEDVPDPRFKGNIVFTPCHVIDGSSFGARVVCTEDAVGNRHEFTDLFAEIAEQLDKVHKDPDSAMLGVFEQGTLCAVLYQVDNMALQLFRAQMVGLVNDDKVFVTLLDVGTTVQASMNRLYQLPECLLGVPPQAVTVHIMGLFPCDFDTNWSFESKTGLRSVMGRGLKERQRWHGSIRMAIGSNLVLDAIEIQEYLPKSGVYSTEFELAAQYLKIGYAVKNLDHLSKLVEHCKDTGIGEIPAVVVRKRVARPSWAFLDEELSMVTIPCVHTTQTFYVNITKYNKILKDLERECRVEGERHISTEKRFVVKPGDVCIVKDEWDEWCRGEVKAVEGEEASVFFVDHGDYQYVNVSRCVPITRRLITKLPFQAIECSLGGLTHSDPTSDVLLDKIQKDYGGDGGNRCYVTWQKKKGKALNTGGNLYDVNLLSLTGESLNKYIVDLGLDSVGENGPDFISNIEMAIEKPVEDEFEPEETPEIDLEALLAVDDLSDLTDEQLKNFSHSYVPKTKEVHSSINLTENPLGESSKQTEKLTEKYPLTEKIPKKVPAENPEEDEEDDIPKSCHPSPHAIWKQTKFSVTITFEILGVAEDSVTISTTSNSVRLECTTEKGQRYEAFYHLYGQINEASLQTKMTPFMVRLTLSKSKLRSRMWPRLLKTKKRVNTLRIDPDMSDDDEDDLFGELQQLKTAEKHETVPDYDSDEEWFQMPNEYKGGEINLGGMMSPE